MYIARFECFDNPVIVTMVDGERVRNISNSSLVMSAGVAFHKYDSPELPSNTILERADVVPAEDILLGVLSLIVISLMTSVVYDVLLRTRGGGKYPAMAIAIAAVLESVERWSVSYDPLAGVRSMRGSRAHYCAVVLVAVLAALTFALDVSLIAATQQGELQTRGDQLGFSLVTPVVTHFGMGQFLRRMAPSRPCIAPVLHGTTGTWRVQVQTCFQVNYTDSPLRGIHYNGPVQYSSAYHSRGSDHTISALHVNISFSLVIRSRIYREDDQLPPLEVVREASKIDDITARIVHASAPIYYETLRLRSENLSCGYHQHQLQYKHRKRHVTMAVAQSIKGIVFENVTLYESIFHLDTTDLQWWLIHALGSAAGSVGIGITRTPTYILGEMNEQATLNTIVYSRKTRRCTVATLAVLVLIAGAGKLISRFLFRPLSLHHLAHMKAMETMELSQDIMEKNIHSYTTPSSPSWNRTDSEMAATDEAYDDMLSYEDAFHMYKHTQEGNPPQPTSPSTFHWLRNIQLRL